MTQINYRKVLFATFVILVSLAPAFLPVNYRAAALLFVVGVIFAAYLLRRPEIGLVSLITANLAIPFAIPTGTLTEINAGIVVLILLVGLWFYRMVVNERKLSFVHSATIGPLIGLGITTLLSFGFGQLPWFPVSGASMSAQLGGVAIFLLAIIAYILTANQLISVKYLNLMCWAFLALIFVYLVGYHFTDQISKQISNTIGYFFSSGGTGAVIWVWVLALSFSQLLYNKTLAWYGRLAILCLLLLTLYVRVVIVNDWTSGWLPGLVGMTAVFLIGSPSIGIIMYSIGGAVGILNFTILRNTLLASNEYSYITRIAAWQILGQIIRIDPLFGVGPANYYFYTPLFSILGYHVRFNSHNNYIDILAQIGFMGMAFFVWFVWEYSKLAWTIRKKAPEGFIKAYVYGCFGGIVGMVVAMMFGDWVFPFVYNIGLLGFRSSMVGWIFLGALVAIEQAVKKTGTDAI
jgi:hypothetical protein